MSDMSKIFAKILLIFLGISSNQWNGIVSSESNDCWSIPKFGVCPINPKFPEDSQKCTKNSECPGNLLCCGLKGEERRCSVPRDSKPGSCPSMLKDENKGKKCVLDSDCEKTRKCCPKTPCEYYCYDAVNATTNDVNKKKRNINLDVKIIKEIEVMIEIVSDRNCYRIPKLGRCPSVLINPGTRRCTLDQNCRGNRVCCYNGTGSYCSNPATSKIGDCPPKGKLIEPGSNNCYVDENCSGQRRCCAESDCSYHCSDVTILPEMTPSDPNCKMILKYGKCPKTLINPGINLCFVHEYCDGNRLCCEDGGGNKKCSDPQPTKPGTCPPPGNLRARGNSTCYVDGNCAGYRRCCKETNCAYYCSDVDFPQKIPSTKYPSQNNNISPICESILKFGNCPAILHNPGANVCFVNEDCSGNRVCCPDSSNVRRCSDPEHKKPGSCPPPGSLINRGESNCYVDGNCYGKRLCCQETPCSFYCSDPVTISSRSTTDIFTLQPTIIDSNCFSIPKFGTCPKILINPGQNQCIINEQCSGNRVCCMDANGFKRCSDPDTDRLGTCPDKLINKGINNCYVDEDCGKGRKCCPESPCSFYCSDVILGIPG